jgi:glycosyltransferase involved in cell wall biosynthesis
LKKRLVIFYDQSFNALVNKGEIVDGYFNVGEIFDDIILINSIQEDISDDSIHQLFGNANFQIRYYGGGLSLFIKTFLWSSCLLRKFAKHIANDILNDSDGFDITVRVYGLNIFCNIGYQVSKILRVSCYISLHSTPDYFPTLGLKKMLLKARYLLLLNRVINPIRDCSATLLVYENLLPFCFKHNILNAIVLRNIVNKKIVKKTFSSVSGTFKIINIGRQIYGKNPLSIIEALSEINNVELTIVGDGELHIKCIELAKSLGIMSKIKFIKSIANNEIGMVLKNFDIFVVQTSYPEFPKTIIEAQQCGLPVIINSSTNIAPEALKSCMIVDNCKLGYKKGIELMQADEKLRIYYSELGYKYVSENYNPNKIMLQYKKLLNV